MMKFKLKIFHIMLKVKKQVILTTYSDTDLYHKEFIITKKFFRKAIEKAGWENEKEFFHNYIYDDAEIIYLEAIKKNCIISEKLINPLF